MVPQLEITTRAPTHTRWQGVKNRRPTTISAAPPYPNRMYPTSRPYTQYRSSIKTGLPYGDLQEYWL
ncbi:hypothetical protein BDA96_07G115800 [Sorghum bicolor]|uniref:Uncharacterized protein n=1 Tax=Sorghum bicolor TaxID=4558 RepID=A0A921U9F2_SORBI|nr:hypothetical protein BDA96_07G115800 [Sorghum bicolor]